MRYVIEVDFRVLDGWAAQWNSQPRPAELSVMMEMLNVHGVH